MLSNKVVILIMLSFMSLFRFVLVFGAKTQPIKPLAHTTQEQKTVSKINLKKYIPLASFFKPSIKFFPWNYSLLKTKTVITKTTPIAPSPTEVALTPQNTDIPASASESLDNTQAPTETPTPIPSPIAIADTPASQTATTSDAFYKNYIYTHESGNDPTRWNTSGCVGLGQACPASKLLAVCPNLDYSCEDQWFSQYALDRYGSWEAAYNYWLANSNW